MAALSDILRRFRFHGVPGAPTAVAVPADRAAEIESELAPVFAALDDVVRLSRELIAVAHTEAGQRRSAAQQEARRLIEQAQTSAVAARAEAATARLAAAEERCRQVLAEGHLEAQRVTQMSEQRMPALVEQMVGYVLEPANVVPTPEERER